MTNPSCSHDGVQEIPGDERSLSLDEVFNEMGEIVGMLKKDAGKVAIPVSQVKDWEEALARVCSAYEGYSP